MGIFLCGHRGSGDHGCEDYLRGICAMLPQKPEVYSQCPEEDWHYGIARLGGLYRNLPGAAEAKMEFGDWCLKSTPGDVRGYIRRGIRPVLLCPRAEHLTIHRQRQMGLYETVAVSEDLSLQLLRQAGLNNVILIPEPAFLVERRLRPMEYSENSVALSLINPGESGSILYRNYCHLIGYILRRTSLHIVLLAYCVKKDQNDGVLHRFLYQKYGHTGRVSLRTDSDSRELQGDLSQCRFCIGGAAAIAAWGCGVPGVCLSATSRTLGLAQTLFGNWQEGVLPWQTLKQDHDLTLRFRELLKKEDKHRIVLENNRHILC